MIAHHDGRHGVTCPLCGMHIYGEGLGRQALWTVHIRDHRDDLIEGCENMLRGCS